MRMVQKETVDQIREPKSDILVMGKSKCAAWYMRLNWKVVTFSFTAFVHTLNPNGRLKIELWGSKPHISERFLVGERNQKQRTGDAKLTTESNRVCIFLSIFNIIICMKDNPERRLENDFKKK